MARLGWARAEAKAEAFHNSPSGNGYCRAEAVVAVLLTKKSLAPRVYATILNAGTNTDGNKEQGRVAGHQGRGGSVVGWILGCRC